MSQDGKKPIQIPSNQEGVARRHMLKYVAALPLFPIDVLVAGGVQEKVGKTPAAPGKPIPPVPELVRGGALSLAPPLGREELEILNLKTEEIKHAFAVAAAEPYTTRFRAGSCAAIAQNYLKTKSPEKQAQARRKANALLRAPLTEQRKNFGRFANQPTGVHMVARKGAEVNLKGKLKGYIAKKIRACEPHGADASFAFMTRMCRSLRDSKTKLEVGEFTRDHRSAQTQLNIFSQQDGVTEYRWSTQEKEATFGRWHIMLPCGIAMPKGVSTSGYAGKAPGGVFDIDLRKFLPPAPSDKPLYFYVQVQPMAMRFTLAQRTSMAEAVGLPSPPVRIAYRKPDFRDPFDNPDIQKALEEDHETAVKSAQGSYSGIEFLVQKVTCVEETSEASESDEISLSSIFTSPAGRVQRSPIRKVSDDFDEGEFVDINQLFAFFDFTWWTAQERHRRLFPPPDGLPHEFAIPWPRTYHITLVMGEEDIDDGFPGIVKDIYNEITEEIVDAIEGLVADAVASAVSSALSSLLGSQLASAIAAAIGSVLGPLVGAIVSAIFGWLISLFEDPDDVLDTVTFKIRLPSDYRVDIDALPDHNKPQTIRFRGGDDSAGGIYDARVIWKGIGLRKPS